MCHSEAESPENQLVRCEKCSHGEPPLPLRLPQCDPPALLDLASQDSPDLPLPPPPTAYHQECHLPTVLGDGAWMCRQCVFAVATKVRRAAWLRPALPQPGPGRGGGLSAGSWLA